MRKKSRFVSFIKSDGQSFTTLVEERVKEQVSNSSMIGLVRFDDHCKNRLRTMLLISVYSKKNLRSTLSVGGVDIIKSVFQIQCNDEYEFICFNKLLEQRFSDSSIDCANKFKSSLEFAIQEFPYCDGFGVACEVFQLAMR